MSYLHGCKQTPATPPTTSDEDSSGSTDDGEMKKKKANRAMGKKKYTKAIKYYSKAVKIDPENATYRLNRAIANAALELWKDAEDDAAKALELAEPPSAKGHYQLVRARLRRGRLEAAQWAANASLEAFPGDAALLQLSKEVDRAITARESKRKKEEEAREARKQGAAASGSVKSLLEDARAAFSADRLEACLSSCEAAREATSALMPAPAAEAAAGEGARGSSAGGLEEAQVQERRREVISVCSLQGRALMRLRRWAEAADALRSGADLQEAIYSMENKEEREALSNSYNNLAIALKNAMKVPKAIDALNKAYLTATNGDDKVATPQTAQILQNIAQCLVQEGKMDEARQMYSRALEIGQRLHRSDHASHALNHMGIARCLRKEGKIPDAIKSYTSAYELWTSKTPEECLAELPEVPSKERLAQLQDQCRQELAQLVLFLEEVKRRQVEEDSAPSADADGLAEAGAAAGEPGASAGS